MKITSTFESLTQGGLDDDDFKAFSETERAKQGKVSDEEFQRFQKIVQEINAQNRAGN